MLAKEPGVRLALCAVHRLYGLALGARPASLDPHTGVVAASSSIAPIAATRMAAELEEHGARGLSVLDAPNASANVLAATVASWFRLGGLAIQLEADDRELLDTSARLLQAGRVHRVLAVRAEPGFAAAVLLGLRGQGRPLSTDHWNLRSIVLEAGRFTVGEQAE
jgi:hypothetical protein